MKTKAALIMLSALVGITGLYYMAMAGETTDNTQPACSAGCSACPAEGPCEHCAARESEMKACCAAKAADGEQACCPAAKAEVGALAPDFTLTDQHGKAVTLSNFHDKSIVVLEWTNFDCPFVKPHYQSGTMIKTAAKYADQKVVWLTINSTHYVKPEDIAKFAEAHKLKAHLLADQSGKVGKLYNARHTPELFVIDKAGKIVYHGAIDNAPRGSLPEGESYVNYVDQALGQLLAGEEITVPKTKPYGCSVKYPPEKES